MSTEITITHIRPRFSFTVPFDRDEVMQRISKLITEGEGKVIGKIHQNHITLDIPANQRHYWSPQLNFRLELCYNDPSKTDIKGLIGPRPAVWTMFMFIYFFIGVLGFILFVYGMSQHLLGEKNYLIYALPVAIIIMLTAYWAGKVGEKLGSDQIETLKQFVRDALDMPSKS